MNKAPLEQSVTVERKFVASRHRLEEALSLLNMFGHPDPRYARGRVHSIYFDSVRLHTWHEKVNGDFLKTKYRLRWYDGTDDPVAAFLEIKHRLGGGRDKIRYPCPMPRAWLENVALDDPALRDALARDGRRDSWPHEYSPAICIGYERHRYICALTGARISLDANICVERLNPALFSCVTPFALEEIVFEFKDIAQVEIPWLGELAHGGFMARSFSKYGECVRRAFEGGAPA